MSDSLVEINNDALKSLQKFDQTDVDSVGGSLNFLPWLQLCGSTSKLCKSGKVPVATYVLTVGKAEQDFVDLGKSVDVILFCSRPKAFWKKDNQNLISFDPKSELFRQIVTEADKPGMNGAFYGPEYLAYIPKVEKFCLIHLNSATNRNRQPDFKALTPGAATLTPEFIDNKKYQWHGIDIKQCSMQLQMPPMEQIREQADRFNNPPAMNVEVAAPEAAPATPDER